MADIKSALEMALERAAQFGKATKEELAEAQYREQGQHLGVRYLKEEGDLEAELRNFPDQAQPALRAAVKEALLRSVILPRNGEPDPHLAKAMEGLLLVAHDRKVMAQLKGELEKLLQNFSQVRTSAFQQLKARFGANIGNVQRAMEAQLRQKVKLEVEQLPQFQEEWRKFMGQLTEQFEPVLAEYKARIMTA